jgi:uroporphyrinogen decarboxylase
MPKLSSKERVLLALNHQEPDRVPIDFGATIATSIVVSGYEKLKQFLGLNQENRWLRPVAQSVIPDDSVLDHFQVDTVPLILGNFSEGATKGMGPEGFVDAWGTTWKKAPDGHFINVDGPFQKKEPTLDELESHTWPNPEDPGLYAGLEEQAEFLKNTTERALILNLPLGVIHQCQFIRGFSEYLMDLASNPEMAKRMMEIVSGIWIRIAANALEVIGSKVDVVAWGDDVGIQDSLMMSPVMYRNHIKPFHQKMIQAIKSRTEAKVFFHSCGAVSPLIEDFIEIGMDALNPLQVSAKGMEPAALKQKFGGRITFWGGIDTHHILPCGSPQEVRKEVRRMVKLMGKGGGYVLAAIHNIQADVPPENVAAMLEEAVNARW